jgi:AAA15 family ATPase/GTPase
MLIRFVVDNLFSFGECKEFTTLANKRLKTLVDHIYEFKDLRLLKMASLYGANGAGKSNMIRALALLKKLILKEKDSKYSSSRLRSRHPGVFNELDAYLKAYLAVLKKFNQSPGK